MEHESYVDEEVNISEKINRIKNLNLDPVDKKSLVLILAGVKPATEMLMFDRYASPEDIISILEDCGLVTIQFQSQYMHEAKKRGVGGTEGYICNVIVARDETTANKVRKYCEPQDDREFGRLMGFPQTAIDAYVSDAENKYESVALLSSDEQGRIMDELNLKQVAAFRLSRAHWQEEIKVHQEWERIVKMYAPELLDDEFNYPNSTIVSHGKNR